MVIMIPTFRFQYFLTFESIIKRDLFMLTPVYNNKIMQAQIVGQELQSKQIDELTSQLLLKRSLLIQSIQNIPITINQTSAQCQKSKEQLQLLKRKKIESFYPLFAQKDFRIAQKQQKKGKSDDNHQSFLLILKNLQRKIHSASNIKVILKTEYQIIHNLIYKYFFYKFYNKQDQTNDVFLFWVDTYVSQEFIKRLKSYQRINHFPNSCELGRKDLLANNLNNAQQFMPQLYDFYPKTWVLPKDLEKFNSRQINQSFYIVKPHANCQGRGIYISKSPTITQKDEVIIQEYVKNPMLIEGCKFDLRIYVLLRSLDPLRIYIYQEGLCRLATSKYNIPTEQNIRNDKMHLTNYAINKLSPNFIGNKDVQEDHKGHKRSLSSAYEKMQSMGYDSKGIKQRIDSIIVRSILAGYSKMLQSYKKSRERANPNNMKQFFTSKQEINRVNLDNNYEQSVCFQLLGFDIMLLNTGQPILLQINHQPSLVTDSPLDLSIKKCLVMDIVNLLNIDEKDKELYQKCREDGTNYRRKGIQQKEIELQGGFRRIYPLHNTKLLTQPTEIDQKSLKYYELYQTMISRIIFRQIKRLSKIRINNNYKTISNQNNRVHISKYSQEDPNNRNALSNQRQQEEKKKNEKKIALTFYNLFDNSRFVMDKGLSQVQQRVSRNFVMLQSIDRKSKSRLERSEERSIKTRQKHENYSVSQEDNFHKKVDFFSEQRLQSPNQANDKQLLTQNSQFSKQQKWQITQKGKSTIQYFSTNKSKKQLQGSHKINQIGFIPTFSTFSNCNQSNLISQRARRIHKISNQNPELGLFDKSLGKDEKKAIDCIIKQQCIPRSKDIYSNSIKEKMEKINNLKIIKSNLHKFNFVNFMERTKRLRNALGKMQDSQQPQRNIKTRQ